jgi:putative lipoic acid-binding regulatory protein
MTEQSLLEFPCEFPIKVMGEDSEQFRQLARELIESHAGRLEAHRISLRTSGAGRYVALTFTISAQSREQLDRIYQALSDCEHVLMSL